MRLLPVDNKNGLKPLPNGTDLNPFDVDRAFDWRGPRELDLPWVFLDLLLLDEYKRPFLVSNDDVNFAITRDITGGYLSTDSGTVID